MKAEKDTHEPQARLITSKDALNVLQMAVGMNPNGTDETGERDIEISPYQLIAGDVNKSGKLTSADALAILKMAVGMQDAFDQEWMFINESEVMEMHRDSITWDSDGVDHSIHQDQDTNFVGCVAG